LLYVDFLGTVGVGRSTKGIAVKGAAREGNTGTLEWLVVRVPGLNEPTFRLYTVIRFEGIQLLDLALILLCLLSQSEAATEKKETKGKNKLGHGDECSKTMERMFVL